MKQVSVQTLEIQEYPAQIYFNRLILGLNKKERCNVLNEG